MTNFDKTLTDWLNYLETQRNRSPSTLREYRRDLTTFFHHILPAGSLPRSDGGGPGRGAGYLPSLQTEHGQVEQLADVTYHHLSAYLVHLKHQHELASSTLSRKIASLKSFFSYAARTYVIPANPAADLDLPTVESRIPQDLSEPQIERLLDQVQGDDWLATRDRAILHTFLNTGVRVSELVELNVAHLDLQRDQIRVIGKGNKERIIPLNRPAKVALLDWLDHRVDLGQPKGSHANALFLTRRSRKRISSRAVQHLVEKYAQAADLSIGVTPHVLRHTFATRLLARGANLREVQDLLGHASPATTAIYTHVNNQQRREAVHRLAPTPTDLLG